MQTLLIPSDIQQRIHFIRGHKVMLDQDLAELYEVPTKALVQAVKRNMDRFPADFMFKLNDTESKMMRSQTVTASKRNIRYCPFAFTEQGVAMLSSVLRSKRAIHVNIAIMRVFVKLREFLINHKELASKLEEIEHKIRRHGNRFKKYSTQIKLIFMAIHKLMEPPRKRRKPIGFKF